MFQKIKDKLNQHIFILNLLFILSGTAMTWLFSRDGIAPQQFKVLGMMVSSIFLVLLVFRYHFLKGILQKISPLQAALALLFALVTWYYYGYKTIVDISIHDLPQTDGSNLLSYLGMTGAAVAFFSIWIWYCAFFDRFLKTCIAFFASLEKHEKWFLFIGTAFFSLTIIIIYSLTVIFYLPYDDNIIFNADTNTVLTTNAHFLISSPKNNIKQPLFALFAMPFSVFSRIVAKGFFFVPNAYIFVFAIVQVFLLMTTLLLIGRMMHLDLKGKILFLIFLSFSYPVLLFSLTYEQYIFAVLWLILLLYSFLFKKENSDFYFLGATGSLLTSAFFFPLISFSKDIKAWLKEVFTVAEKFILAVVIFGQLPVVLHPIQAVEKQLNSFTGHKLTFAEKFLQYINFVATCLIRPETKMNAQYTSYQLAPARDLNDVGVALLAVALLGFFLNHHKTFARICFSWVVYSFIVLCVVGWGTKENGLVLYTLYFSWAFLSLAFMAIDSIFHKMPAFKHLLIGGIIAAILYINIPGIFDLIQFGINYYYTQ